MSDQIEPLGTVVPVFLHDYSDYPEIVRVPFANGKVVNYNIDVEMPHPAFRKVMGLLEKIPYSLSDKGYRAKHQKKSR